MSNYPIFTPLSFIKKFHRVSLFLVFVISFFYVYNFVVVDRSLISLKIALAQAAEAKTVEDFQRIKSLLKAPIFTQISGKDISSRQLISMELAGNIADSGNLEAAKDASFYLKEAIKAREEGRPGIFSALDNINVLLFKPSAGLSEKSIKAKISSLASRIKLAQDKTLLQELYFEIANYYLQLKDYAAAESSFLEAVKIEPYSKIAIRSRFNLGWLYKISGQLSKASEYFNKLSQDYTEKDSDLSVSCQYQIADSFYKTGDFLKARNLYAVLANDNPQFKSTDFGLLEAGNISLYKLGDIKAAALFLEAFSLYQRGEEFSVSLKKAMEDIGLLRASGDSPAAAESRIPIEGPKEAALSPAQKAEDLRRKGFRLLKEEKYGEAVSVFKTALDIAPADGGSRSGLSLGYFWLKQDAPALAEARRSVTLAPADELVVTNAIFVFINAKLPEEAIAAGEKLLSQRKVIRRPQVYYNIGYAYIMLKKVQEGAVYFRNAMRLDPEFTSAMNNLGVVLWSRREFDDGIKLLLKVVAQNPEYVDAQYNLGAIYLNMRRMQEAYRQFELVLDIDPDYKDVKRYMDFILDYLKKK